MVRELFEQEQAKITRDRAYRSPVSVLKKLASAELYLPLFKPDHRPGRLPRAGEFAGLVTDHIARNFAGDRAAATRHEVRRVARILGASDRARWPEHERRAFERLALLAAVIPDLADWPASDRRSLVAVLRAKGGRSETRYVRLLDAHVRFRRSLENLVTAAAGGTGTPRDSHPP